MFKILFKFFLHEIRKFIFNIIKRTNQKNNHQTTMAYFLNSLAFVEIENDIKLTIKKLIKNTE